ncbi:uncharacterized protein LOC125313927 isoform X2 [Rhodamnia argentea]|uniref:Uncharacterized protein LOC125313927 isoform X2 n=1 Tax=Rhodamnia argentea TaxID=178133 RepID=A0ABM3H3J9_9MYRT|nr:uncharacterized protein LOC125313927 isoform X2 [Rhodamnia argentea]
MTRVCDTWEALFDLHRGNQFLSEHYARFMTLCGQLDTYLPTWNDSTILIKRQEHLRVILYLKALGLEYSPLRPQITSRSSLPTVDEIFSRALRSTPAEKISTPSMEVSATISHGTNACGARGRGYGGRGRGFAQSGGRDRGIGARSASIFGGGHGSRYRNHCQRTGHTEAYCYILHPELQPTFTAYAEVKQTPQDSTFTPHRTPPDSTDVQNTSGSITLTVSEYDAWVRSQPVTGPSAPTATLAQTSKGSEE